MGDLATDQMNLIPSHGGVGCRGGGEGKDFTAPVEIADMNMDEWLLCPMAGSATLQTGMVDT